MVKSMSPHPGLDILREFTIADTSFSVTGSRYIVLGLLFFMYDIGSVWFGGMFFARLEPTFI